MDPGSAAHPAARHSASKTRVNALMALRSVRGTRYFYCLSVCNLGASFVAMDAEASPPSRSVSTHLRSALSTCRWAWSHAARLALDIALPTLCVACREPVDGEGVCSECWTKLSFIAPPYCPRLGIPFVYDPGPDMLSMEAIANPPAYTRARAAVRYDDVARTLVHALKYQDRTDLAPAMGRWMARAGHELLDGADVLVPVPLHCAAGVEPPLQSIRCIGANHRAANRRHGGVRRAPAYSADPAAGRPVEATAGEQRPGRLQGLNPWAIADRRPPRGPDRRCPDLRRDSGCLRTGAVARQSCASRRAGVRPGCG